MFWENYLALCNSVGKSPNAVASEIGIKSSGTVTGWSNGAIPRKSVLFKLAQYFEVTEQDLLSENILMDHVPLEKSTRGMSQQEREAFYKGLHVGQRKEKPADQMADGFSKYDLLNDENRAAIDALIDRLLASQSDE